MSVFSRGFVGLAGLVLALAWAPALSLAQTSDVKLGVVLMHGKGGSPKRHVPELARELEAQGLLVANLEMPWSARRQYDVNVEAAVAEVDAALSALRAQGAQKLFVAGHSQGGVFALYLGTRSAVDGVVAIAPGGNVANQIFREKLGEYLSEARKRVAEGKGEEKTRLADFESAKGTFPVISTPAAYLSWFDPEGAMNQVQSLQAIKPGIPVLYIAPRGDYPALQRINPQRFGALPKNPHTRLYEPDASHTGAPAASAQEIVNWTRAVANP